MIAHLLVLARWEWFKLRRRWAPWVLLGILLLFTQLVVISSFFINRENYDAAIAEAGYYMEVSIDDELVGMRVMCDDLRDGGVPPEVEAMPEEQRPYVNFELEDARTRCGLGGERDFFVLPASIAQGLGVTHALSIMLFMFLVASALGSEYSWGTLRTVLTKGSGRWQFLGSKAFTLLIMGAAGLLVVSVGVLVSSLIFGSFAPTGGIADQGDWAGVAKTLGKSVYALVPYLALALFFTVLTTSTGVGTALAFGYFVVESIMVGILAAFWDWFDSVAQFVLGTNVSAWMQEEGTAIVSLSPLNVDPPGALHAFFVILAYALIIGAGAFWLFQRKDVTGAKGD